MTDTSMNLFDLGVVIIVGLSAMLAFYRGFIREVLSLGGWVVASIVSLRFLEPAANYIKPQVGSEPIAVGIAAIGLFFITLILFSIVTSMIVKALKLGSRVGLLDNLAGLCFGAARGVFIIAIMFFVMTKFFTDEKSYPEVVRTAMTRPYVEKAATWLGTLTPEYLDKVMKKNKGKLSEEMGKARDEGVKRVSEDMKRMRESMAKEAPDESSLPSIEDLQQRIREENAKSGNR